MPSSQLLNTAYQHLQAGRLQEAEAVCRQIIASDPSNADALNLLGVIGIQVGRLDDAMRFLRVALAFQPEHPFASYNLANAQLAKGQTADAISGYQQFLAKNPKHFPAYCNLGIAFLKQNRFEEAISAFQKALAINSNLVEAHYNLGTAFQKKGDLDHALASYQNAFNLRSKYPDHPNPSGRPLNVKEDAPPLLAYKSDFAQVLNVIGGIYREKGDLESAIASFKRALEINPRFALAQSNLGYVYRDLGRFDEALECFRQGLASNPQASLYKGLALSGRHVADDTDIKRLTELLDQPNMTLEDRIDAEFALGRMLDENEAFDEAFSHLATANRLFKESREAAGERVDPEETRRLVDRTIESFTAKFFADRHSWGNSSDLPVFILGMPRSGTSLVEQIAASHPSVFGAGELKKLSQLSASIRPYQEIVQGFHGDSHTEWDKESIAQSASAYLDHVRSLGGIGLRVTDKMPGNVFHLGLIALLFPNARVVFCRRDPRDNCLSCYFERFNKSNLLYTYDLATCGREYLETDRLTKHWLRTLPLQMLEVQYETLVAEQEGQSRRLIDFLGLPWNPACLEFHRTKRPVTTASAWQVRQPVYNRSVGRWRHYERHLKPLLDVLGTSS